MTVTRCETSDSVEDAPTKNEEVLTLGDGGVLTETVVTQRMTNIERMTDEEGLLEAGQRCADPSAFWSTQGQRWRSHPLEAFTSRLSKENDDLKKAPKSIRDFYRKQDAHIKDLEKVATLGELLNKSTNEDGNPDAKLFKDKRNTKIIVRTVFLANLCLLLGKTAAAIFSGSLAIISSLLDSCVDLVSGGIMWFTARQMRKRRPYTYPQGRARLEPIAVIVLAVFMSSLSIQIVIESIQSIIQMSSGKRGPPEISNLTISLVSATVLIKFVLWILCIKFGQTQAVRTLKVDQRNDVFSNLATLILTGLAGRIPPLFPHKGLHNLQYLDPIGAILISAYIMYSWYKLGGEQIRNLAGLAADPDFIKKIAFICLNHHAAIERLEMIRAFHFGYHFLVEVHIVLPMGMRLKEAHDIGESLQRKIETLANVERAFVHLDYDFTHHPDLEHKAT
ncbi:unnamed protein product [Calicophoron daubneyi]|uniref:Cation efflux protein cytoplasmic domain-containing protein n=1 Tax=Calicophoron daubneyi TaxID=300641 RepID=A0AAV2SYM9_CALDB